MAGSARVQDLKTRQRRGRDMFRRLRLRLNMRRRPEPTRSNARRRTWASQAWRRHPGPEILMTVVLCRPKKQADLIPQPIAEEIRGVQRTTMLHPRPPILATFRPWH